MLSSSYYLIFVIVANVIVKWCLIIFLIYISWNTCENMHLFICLLALWGFSSVNAAFEKETKDFLHALIFAML